MDLGGFCASGGPYVIAVECPDAVIATTPLSIFGGFLAAGLMAWGGAAPAAAAWMSLVFLAWPALFLSLGWNFLEYGFFPPERRLGLELARSAASLFVLMGAVPLVLAIGALRAEGGGGRSYASGRVVVRPSRGRRPPDSRGPPSGRSGRDERSRSDRGRSGGRTAGGPARAPGGDAPARRPHVRGVRDREGGDPGRGGGLS